MAYPASDQKPPCATGCSRAQGPSGASPARSSAHRTPGATDNTSPRSRRSGGLRPPCSGPARPEHLSAATWRRSLQACIASLPLQSSLMSKTYLKSDHFNGGGAAGPWPANKRSGCRGLGQVTSCCHEGGCLSVRSATLEPRIDRHRSIQPRVAKMDQQSGHDDHAEHEFIRAEWSLAHGG